MTKHRDGQGVIIEVGDRVRVTNCLCDASGDYCGKVPACEGSAGVIHHFVDGRTSDEHNMASVHFDNAIPATRGANCAFYRGPVDGTKTHDNCLIYLSELTLLKPMHADPKQLHLGAFT